MEPGRVPRFDEVEADVKSAWRDARYLEIKRAALEEMRVALHGRRASAGYDRHEQPAWHQPGSTDSPELVPQ